MWLFRCKAIKQSREISRLWPTTVHEFKGEEYILQQVEGGFLASFPGFPPTFLYSMAGEETGNKARGVQICTNGDSSSFLSALSSNNAFYKACSWMQVCV